MPSEVTIGVQKLPMPSPSGTVVPARAQSSLAPVPRSFGERLLSLVPGGNREEHLWLSKRTALPERAKKPSLPPASSGVEQTPDLLQRAPWSGRGKPVSLVRQAPHCLFIKGQLCQRSPRQKK